MSFAFRNRVAVESFFPDFRSVQSPDKRFDLMSSDNFFSAKTHSNEHLSVVDDDFSQQNPIKNTQKESFFYLF